MAARLATLITIMIILYLFRAERGTEGISRGIWIPFCWMFLAGSRYVSQWLNYNSSPVAPEALADGSPLDRLVFLLLIVLGILVLVRRKPDWKSLFGRNRWIMIYLVFTLLSVTWSDYPWVSLKRWIKALGNPLMALILLTEERPLEAIGAVLRRLSYVLLPLSILFIKFYPELGRTYHMGQPMFSGVAGQKNGLGQLCLIVAIWYLWNALYGPETAKRRGRRSGVYLLMVPMIAWLLLVADSATSQMCLVLAALLLALGRARSVAEAPGRALALTLTAAAAAGILESVFGLSARVLQLLGRDPSLTSRVPIWTGLIQSAGNPVLGTGYESFWLGHRLLLLLEAYGVRQAHNGFVETYLNLGFVGLFLMLAIFLSGMRKAWRQLEVDLPRGLLRLTLILVVFAYNWTEATLYGLSNMWLLLLLGSLEAPDRQAVLVPERRTGRGTPPGLALPGALRSRS